VKKTIVCLAALGTIAVSPVLAWNRGGDMDEVILGPGATAEKIQAALDGLPKSGGTVALRPGTYIINKPVSLCRDNQTLRGAGPTTVLRLADNANCPLLVVGTLESYPRRIVYNVRVRDLDIDGNRTNQQVECWATPTEEGSEIRNNGLTVRGATDCIVERVRCYRARSGGFVAEKGVYRLTVSDFAAWDNQFDGLALYETEESIFSRLVLRDNPGAGISLDRGFRQSAISDAVLVANGIGIFMRHTHESVFTGLVIRNSKEHGVFMAQTAEKNPAGEWVFKPGTACTGNVFSGMHVSDSGGAGFLLNNDTCAGNVMQGGRFVRNVLGGFCESKPGLIKTSAIVEE
jgi:hypothetical protein